VRGKHRLRTIENRGMRKRYGPRRDEVTGNWRRLHNVNLHELYSSSDIIGVIKSRMRWAGHVARMGERTSAHRGLLGTYKGKKPLGRPSCRRENNVKMGVQEVEWTGMDWIELAQDRDRWLALVTAVMNPRVP
jgi:hypothetical protein